VLVHLLDLRSKVLPRRRITQGMPVEEFEAAGSVQTAHSLESAIAAAARHLGGAVVETGGGARLIDVRPDTGGVQSGDLVVGVDGTAINTARELEAALAERNTAAVDVLADPFPAAGLAQRTVTLARHDDGKWGLRAVTSARAVRHECRAEFDLPADVRGPSLGLACALAVVDAYTDGRLAAGGHVVATGTVDLTGRVGSVGGIEHKARAAAAHPQVRRFLLPAEVDEDVRVARRVLDGRAEVVPVSTLADAVAALRLA
jgi:PDZ domain-containing protein